MAVTHTLKIQEGSSAGLMHEESMAATHFLKIQEEASSAGLRHKRGTAVTHILKIQEA